MPLIDLQTSLKDLKYGHDEYEGGNSKQPYIKTKIPATNDPLPISFGSTPITGDNLGAYAAIGATIAGIGAATGFVAGGGAAGAAIGAGAGLALTALVAGEDINYSTFSLKTPRAGTGGNDFLFRGGTLLPGIVLSDEERLGKFFFSGRGLFFTLKQNVLSRTAVRTEASSPLVNEDFYVPTNTLAQAGVSAAGLHLNKQGLTPVGENFLDATGNPVKNRLSLSTYRKAVQYDQYSTINNPAAAAAITTLAGFGFDTIAPPGSYDSLANNRLVALFRVKVKKDLNYKNINGIIIDGEDPVNLLEYPGGPGSILGIGRTKIKLHCGGTLNRKANPQDTDRNTIRFEIGDFPVKVISTQVPKF